MPKGQSGEESRKDRGEVDKVIESKDEEMVYYGCNDFTVTLSHTFSEHDNYEHVQARVHKSMHIALCACSATQKKWAEFSS